MVKFKRIHKLNRPKKKYPKTPVVRRRKLSHNKKRNTQKRRMKQQRKTQRRKYRGGMILPNPTLLNTNGKTQEQYAYMKGQQQNNYVHHLNKLGGGSTKTITIKPVPNQTPMSGHLIKSSSNILSKSVGLNAVNSLNPNQVQHNKAELQKQISKSQ